LLHRTLNLGILAHVDAGKTTLTERLLYEAGVIDVLGSVDAGTTQTDSLALERRRGITIRSAVASFAIGELAVNLIDTPGHPDFIAEVERVLGVLDGAVLVVSAVEGVQPQTRILMRALQRLHIPTLVFVNKIDRVGADEDSVLRALAERLAIAAPPMGTTAAIGTRAADFVPAGEADTACRARLAELLAERDEEILAAYVEHEPGLPYTGLRAALAEQVKHALVHPVFFGSAVTGAGVEQLRAGIAELLPPSAGDPDGPVSGTVFKIERGAGGEKIVYARLFSGTITTRDRLHVGRAVDDKVTAIAVFERGSAVQRPAVTAGSVAKLWGLHEVQVGDRIVKPGSTASDRGLTGQQFLPPTLESVVVARNRDDGARLRVALAQLAEQDPLINVRQGDAPDEIAVSLYGEVQKEVIESTLASEYGLEVTFRETTPLYIERPTRSGEAIELLHAESNPFLATIGLRIEPAPNDSGIEFRLEVAHDGIPLYVYKRRENFDESMTRYVRESLQAGLYGWQVTDCIVTMTSCSYSVPDGPPSRRGPLSTAADFRKLTPLVLGQALEHAGTTVCEPIVHATLEVPTTTTGAVLSALGRLGAELQASAARGQIAMVEAILSAVYAQELQRQLPGLTGGEGVLESTFAGYQPATGEPPRRRRESS
jgi:ribosomal protection tetracycline resistance protein